MGVVINTINLPLVSIIITTFNRSNFLTACLESIVSQTYTNIEVLVVDDGSQSKIAIENKEICNNYKHCTYYFKENTGQPASRNYGIKKAKGEYIAFCDDDDLWALNKLEKQVKVLQGNINIGLVTGSIEYIKLNGEKTKIIKTHEGHNHGYVFKELLIKNRTSSITPILRKEVFEKVGLFNPNFIIAEDWEFWRRVSYHYKFYFIDEVLAYVRLHDNNMSNTRTSSVLERYILYRKLTKSLMKWGVDRFAKKDFQLIRYIEWCYYRKLFSNNLVGITNKIKFSASISNDLPHLLKLYIRHNKNYKIQK